MTAGLVVHTEAGRVLIDRQVGAAVRQALEDAGMSMTDLAVHCQCSVGHVSNVIRGDGSGRMPVWFLVKVCEATGSMAPLQCAAGLAGVGGAKEWGPSDRASAGAVLAMLADGAGDAGVAQAAVAGALSDGHMSADEAAASWKSVAEVLRAWRKLARALLAVSRSRRGVGFETGL